jgi:hypothetical protein
VIIVLTLTGYAVFVLNASSWWFLLSLIIISASPTNMDYDWEYEYLKDAIFLEERNQQIMNEYYQWEEEIAIKKMKPATIEVVIKKPEYETNNNTIPF